jgi:hypothetical protein
MKKTKLERFIRDNREDFDHSEAPAGLWAKIDKSLGENLIENQNEESFSAPEVREIVQLPHSVKLKVWAIAASIALLIGCFLAFYLKNNPKGTEQIVSEVAPQYNNKMVQYASLIEIKREEIRQIETHDPIMYKEFASEIEKLNQDYRNLQDELPQTPNQEELVEAMIQNLRVQLDILNRQLIIIQKVKARAISIEV